MFALLATIVVGFPWTLVLVICLKIKALVVLFVITVNKNLRTLKYRILPNSRHDVVDVNKVES